MYIRIAAETLPAKPSGRQYYVWQFAMWAAIVHAVCLCGFVLLAAELSGKGFGFVRWNIFANGFNYHQIADNLSQSIHLVGVAAVALVPLAAVLTLGARGEGYVTEGDS